LRRRKMVSEPHSNCVGYFEREKSHHISMKPRTGSDDFIITVITDLLLCPLHPKNTFSKSE